jgi:hypothetical protein
MVLKPYERKVENINEFVKDVKLIYHFEYHLSFPKPIFSYRDTPKMAIYARSFKPRSDYRIKGFNYIRVAPGPKPSTYTPKVVTDGIKY